MIQGLEKLLFKRMWLTPHHFKLAVQTMLIVLFSGFFWPRRAKCLLRQGVEGALGRGRGLLEASQVPHEVTSRKRPSRWAAWCEPTAWGVHGSRQRLVFC